eukprot:jgi/Mesen1/9363/ME000061S08811
MGKPWLQAADAYVNPDSSKEVQDAAREELSSQLLQHRLSIQQVVQGMAEYLTVEDNAVRARGTLLLGELVRELGSSSLQDPVLHSLAAFFAARLVITHTLSLNQASLKLEESDQAGALLDRRGWERWRGGAMTRCKASPDWALEPTNLT